MVLFPYLVPYDQAVILRFIEFLYPDFTGYVWIFYLYSQLGTYFSDMPTDSSLYSVDGFINDIEDVRIGLGLDSVIILPTSVVKKP